MMQAGNGDKAARSIAVDNRFERSQSCACYSRSSFKHAFECRRIAKVQKAEAAFRLFDDALNIFRCMESANRGLGRSNEFDNAYPLVQPERVI